MTTQHSARKRGELPWHKSSYSGSSGGDCVEVATSHHTTHVRDSKDAHGPVLSLSRAPWAAFLTYATQQRR